MSGDWGCAPIPDYSIQSVKFDQIGKMSSLKLITGKKSCIPSGIREEQTKRVASRCMRMWLSLGAGQVTRLIAVRVEEGRQSDNHVGSDKQCTFEVVTPPV